MKKKPTVIDVLVYAKGLLEKGWCQTAGALNKRGESVRSRSADAIKWCATGAINRAVMDLTGGDWEEKGVRKLDVIANEELLLTIFRRNPNWDGTVIRWNDHPKLRKPEVLKTFAATITRLRKEKRERDAKRKKMTLTFITSGGFASDRLRPKP